MIKTFCLTTCSGEFLMKDVNIFIHSMKKNGILKILSQYIFLILFNFTLQYFSLLQVRRRVEQAAVSLSFQTGCSFLFSFPHFSFPAVHLTLFNFARRFPQPFLYSFIAFITVSILTQCFHNMECYKNPQRCKAPVFYQ